MQIYLPCTPLENKLLLRTQIFLQFSKQKTKKTRFKSFQKENNKL